MGRKRGRRATSPDDLDAQRANSSQSHEEDFFVIEEISQQQTEEPQPGTSIQSTVPQAAPKQDNEKERPRKPLDVPKRLRKALQRVKTVELPNVYKPVPGYVAFEPYNIKIKQTRKDFRMTLLVSKLFFFGMSYIITGFQVTFCSIVYYDQPVNNKLIFTGAPHIKLPIFLIELLTGIWLSHKVWIAPRRLNGLITPFTVGLIITHCVTTIPSSGNMPISNLFGTLDNERKLIVRVYVLGFTIVISYLSVFFDTIVFASVERGYKESSMAAYIIFKIIQVVSIMFTLILTYHLGYVLQIAILLAWAVIGCTTYIAVFLAEENKRIRLQHNRAAT